jgi:hypothetical protein
MGEAMRAADRLELCHEKWLRSLTSGVFVGQASAAWTQECIAHL